MTTTENKKKIYYVRHGEAEHNVEKVFTDADTPLTEHGRQQALETAKELKKLQAPIIAIVSSSMARAHNTARIIADELGLPQAQIVLDDRIRELKSGRFAGAPNTLENHQKRDAHFLDRNNPMGVEWIGDYTQRLEAFVADIAKRPEDSILVVGHNAVGRMLQRIFGGHERTKPMGRLRNAEVMQLQPYVELDENRDKLL